ncbi:hypothetical protein HUU62_04810 [Rhodoferax sp. 4810]|nr:hypothetical protein [Rhodoferax jenense]
MKAETLMGGETTAALSAGGLRVVPDREGISRLSQVEGELLKLWQSKVNDVVSRLRALEIQHTSEISSIQRTANSEIANQREGFFWDDEVYVGESRVSFGYGFKSKAFASGWWLVALGVLIVGWVFLNFSTGFLLGLVSIPGYPFLITRLMNRRLEYIEQIASNETKDTDAAKQEHVLRKHPLTEEWNSLCLEFSHKAEQVSKAALEIFEKSQGRLSSLAQTDDGDMVQIGNATTTSFCFGFRQPGSFAAYSKDACSLLQSKNPLPKFLYVLPEIYDLSQHRSLTIMTNDDRESSHLADRLVNSFLLRVLLQVPPGKAVFSFFDPVGLGASFAQFLSLGDHSENVMGSGVLTNERQIRRKLEDTLDHIQNVTQKYLKAEYADIESYNKVAGEIAEPYRFLVLRGYPSMFTPELAKSLDLILQNGPRCGVYVILEATGARVGDPFKAECTLLYIEKGGTILNTRQRSPVDPRADEIELDTLPGAAVIRKVVDAFGRQAADAMKVEVPYEALLPRAGYDSDWWQDSSADVISVPLGPVGARDVLRLTFDSRMSHNALIVGRPGSGKSNLLHVFISMIARRYAPNEAELYLIDFKKGVEFKGYANSGLPHARVIAVESEREFGISVLKAIDAEMTLRSEAFKKADGVENIGEYRRKMPAARMPRAVLIIDEFQEFFTREDKVKEEALMLLDRIIRQGRSFGIHTLLGTQGLSNSGLPRSIIDQVPIRIALQCSEADSRQILGDDNTVARSLTRPGEAIYNDKAGLIEGNRQFQVALFPNEQRKAQTSMLEAHVRQSAWAGRRPRIFEGQEPASLGTCAEIRRFSPANAASAIRLWIGEPVSLDAPVFYKLAPQPGRNLIVVGSDEKRSADVILSSLTSLAVQLPPRDLEIKIIDLTTADAEWADFPESFRDAFPHRIEVGGKHDLRRVLTELASLVETRRAEQDRTSDNRMFSGLRIIFALVGLHRVRELRGRSEPVSIFAAKDSGKAVEKDLNELVKQISADGPEVGVHTMLWVDSLASFEKVLGRSGLDEFAVRVCGPLSERESHALLDNTLASRIDKPNRMILFDDDLVGVYTPFRPYAVPSEDFFEGFVEQAFATDEKGAADE